MRMLLAYYFKEDLTEPIFNDQYKVCYSKEYESELTLLHKLIFFPALLKQFLQDASNSGGLSPSVINATTKLGITPLSLCFLTPDTMITHKSAKMLLTIKDIDIKSLHVSVYHDHDSLQILLLHPDLELDKSRVSLLLKYNENIDKIVTHPNFKSDYLPEGLNKYIFKEMEKLKKVVNEELTEYKRLQSFDLGSLLYQTGKKYI